MSLEFEIFESLEVAKYLPPGKISSFAVGSDERFWKNMVIMEAVNQYILRCNQKLTKETCKGVFLADEGVTGEDRVVQEVYRFYTNFEFDMRSMENEREVKRYWVDFIKVGQNNFDFVIVFNSLLKFTALLGVMKRNASAVYIRGDFYGRDFCHDDFKKITELAMRYFEKVLIVSRNRVFCQKFKGESLFTKFFHFTEKHEVPHMARVTKIPHVCFIQNHSLLCKFAESKHLSNVRCLDLELSAPLQCRFFPQQKFYCIEFLENYQKTWQFEEKTQPESENEDELEIKPFQVALAETLFSHERVVNRRTKSQKTKKLILMKNFSNSELVEFQEVKYCQLKTMDFELLHEAENFDLLLLRTKIHRVDQFLDLMSHFEPQNELLIQSHDKETIFFISLFFESVEKVNTFFWFKNFNDKTRNLISTKIQIKNIFSGRQNYLLSLDFYRFYSYPETPTLESRIAKTNLRKHFYTNKISVGVFCGTFDPFHENHFRMCQLALKKYCDHLVICPNTSEFRVGREKYGLGGAEPFKMAVDMDFRCELIQKRIEIENLEDKITIKRLEKATDWTAKEENIFEIETQFLENQFVYVNCIQLIGDDSFFRALSRACKRKRGSARNSGILGFSRQNEVLICVRTGDFLSGDLSEVPNRIRENITIADYEDEIQMSSSEIRDKVCRGEEISAKILHPKLLEIIKAKGRYLSEVDQVMSHYDRIFDSDTKQYSLKTKNLRSEHNFLKACLIYTCLDFGFENPISVLDLCCGKGSDLIKFIKNPFRIVNFYEGRDISKQAVEDAKNRAEKLHTPASFLQCDAFEYVGERRFNIVSCQFGLQYAFSSRVKAEKAADAISRAMKTNALFICIFPSFEKMKKLLTEENNYVFENRFIKIIGETKPQAFGKYVFHFPPSIMNLAEYFISPEDLENIFYAHSCKILRLCPISELPHFLDDSHLHRLKTIFPPVEMTEEEIEVTSLYEAAVFRKIYIPSN